MAHNRHQNLIRADVRFGSKADMCRAKGYVRSTPESGHVQCNEGCPLCANSGHRVHSINLSARSSSVGRHGQAEHLRGFKIDDQLMFRGAWTGRSAGFAVIIFIRAAVWLPYINVFWSRSQYSG